MQRVILMAKRPRPGRVKTRLVPPLTPETAAQLYRALLSDSLARLPRLAGGAETELCLDGPWPSGDDPLDRRVSRQLVTLQGSGDLGQRMLRAARRAAAEGARGVVFLGADSPTLPRDRVARALEELERGTAAVLAPSDDGGYVLIGMRRPEAALFHDIPWGGPRVAELTLERADRAGLTCRRLPGWYDVDDRAGLLRLARELARDGAIRAPASAGWLARSGLDSASGMVL